MTRRTPSQQIAELEQRLAAAKDRQRRARTHRLCVFAGAFPLDAVEAFLTLSGSARLSAVDDFAAAMHTAAAERAEVLRPPGRSEGETP